MARFCVSCGTEIAGDNSYCPNCGAPVERGNSRQAEVVYGNQGVQEKSNGFSIAGFVISLVSSLLCCGIFNILGLIFSIIGVVKAKSCGGKGKGLGIAGIIISSIGIVLMIFCFTIGTFSAAWNDVKGEIDDQWQESGSSSYYND